MNSRLISLRGVVFQFDEGTTRHPVLRGVSGTVMSGEWVALLGQSGSGKSTLLHLIAGLDLPGEGSIEIGGVTVSELDERARTLFRRRHVGFVYQAFNLLPTLTVLENVALVAELNGLRAADARRRAAELLGEVGLDAAIERYPDRLSGGEQQRVAIARALVHDPWLLLADEPTGNLDAGNGERVLDLLDAILRRRGHTLLIATHSPEVAARADRIWHLKDGLLETR
jgi:putative ABC transport system ATP-binding protein